MVQFRISTWTLLAATSFLAACGGGGGGDESSSSIAGSSSSPGPTYSISASITGLTASGLVLQNNGGGSVTVASGASTASIATGVSSGVVYAVTVQTQPTGQLCTVANGTGTVTANVSNIAVTCAAVSATTHTVGGTITGLSGTGLTVRLNGNADASFNVSPASGAGNFTFAAGLAAGTPYTVAIAEQPTSPTQACSVTSGQSGTMGNANVTNVVINCVSSAPYTVGGTVSGLSANGLSLRMGYTGASTPAVANVAANSSAFAFTETVPANGEFNVGILTQPTGQTCTIVRGRGNSTGNVNDVSVACVNNATGPLSGTYSLVNSQGRWYFNFNADGTYTTVFIHNEATACNTSTDTNNGDGVEYGVFTWNQTTSVASLVTVPVVDTNGKCGFSDSSDGQPNFVPKPISLAGNAFSFQNDEGGTVSLNAVDSDPATLIGAFVPEANNGSLLVFHADGTFTYAETQARGTASLNRQERGCYEVNGSTVTFTIGGNCRPDGFAPYDFNGSYGLELFTPGMPTLEPWSFTINSPTKITLNGVAYKRTQPN